MEFLVYKLCASARILLFKCIARAHALFFLVFLLVTPLSFSATPANTLIQNRATVDFLVSGVPTTLQSNIEQFRVEELIELTLISNDPSGVSVQTPHTNGVLSYTLTNTGNGTETFTLTVPNQPIAPADQFNIATPVRIYLDTNNTGIYEAGTDPQYTSGSNDPALDPDESINLFIVSNIPSGLSAGDIALVDLTASSLTGTGASGTVFAAQGDGGVDAMLGLQGGDVTAQNNFVITNATASVTKSMVIDDQLGGNAPIQNAVITYTLALTLTGAGTFTNLLVRDNIPANTTYIPNSITLNGTGLSDAADVDAGAFTGTGTILDPFKIEVSPGSPQGTLAAPTASPVLVTFQVRIN